MRLLSGPGASFWKPSVAHVSAAVVGSLVVPHWALDVLAGVVGLGVGSFANVVVYRTPRHLSVVRPGSFCPNCSTPIRAFDNVPVVSWLVLRGRCRSCGARIAVRYPLVEAAYGVLFALVALATGSRWSVFGLCALAAGLAASAVIELEGQQLPPAVPEIGAVLGLAGLATAAGVEHHWTRFAGAGVGALVALGAVPALGHWARSMGRRSTAAWWALVPAGAVIGWSGPIGAATGAGMACLAVLLLGGERQRSGSDATAPAAGDGQVRRHALAAAGPAVAAVLGAVAAVVAALGAGAPLG